MDTPRTHLLVRVDFILDRSRGGDRLTFKRWRHVLADALPLLLRLRDRCPRAVVRLHHGEEEGLFSAWLRIPIKRFPTRKRLAKIKAKLRDRLESGLLAVGGDVIKIGVRRRQPRHVLRLVQLEAVPLRLAQTEPELASS